MLAFSDTKTEEKRGRKASLSSPTGGPHAGGGGSSESHIKGKIFCLPALCRLQSSAVLQREICSTGPIFKQIPLLALPPPFPCPKQGICNKPPQAISSPGCPLGAATREGVSLPAPGQSGCEAGTGHSHVLSKATNTDPCWH